MNTTEFKEKLLLHESSLGYFALSLTKNQEDAEDLVQDTFLKAIQYQDKYTIDNNIRAWLFTILRNTYLNQVTKLSSKNTVNNETEYESVIKNTLHETENAESEINASNIYETIEMLNDEYGIPLKMFIEGYKYKEIAEITTLPMGTIKSRIFFARRILMENLQDFR